MEIFKELLKEYWKQLFLVVVTPTFSWWSGAFQLVSEYLYTKTYVIDRSILIITALIFALFSSLILRKYKALNASYLLLKSSLQKPKLNLDDLTKKVLSLIFNTPEGYVQSKSTLVDENLVSDTQTAQYYLDKLERLGFIESNHYLPATGEPQYELTSIGRKYVIENSLQKYA